MRERDVVAQLPNGNEDPTDLFAAMNFAPTGDTAADREPDALTALSFAAAEDGGDDSPLEPAPEYAAAEPVDTATVLAAQAGAPEEDDEEDVIPLFTVTNPPGTVSVSALGDGGIEQVALSEKVASMTEAELAEEIIVIAHLATQKGQAAQHDFLLQNMRELGADDPDAVRDLLEYGMELTSPERAAETQAHVFATRYATE